MVPSQINRIVLNTLQPGYYKERDVAKKKKEILLCTLLLMLCDDYTKKGAAQPGTRYIFFIFCFIMIGADITMMLF